MAQFVPETFRPLRSIEYNQLIELGEFAGEKLELLDGVLFPRHASGVEDFRPLRRAEYDRLIELGILEREKVELLEGWMVPVSPIHPPHGSAVEELTHVLIRALDRRAKVRVQLPFAALDTSEPEPDLALVPLEDHTIAHPHRAHLLIEVADSSVRYDRTVKLSIYARCGVPEYWIVNVVDKRIQVHRSPVGETYTDVQHFERGQSVALLEFPDVVVQVDEIIRG